MKYNCEACGMYVEAGSGHSCYTPTPPRAELDRERERIAELEAENQRVVAESKQCHEQNDRLVSERLKIKAENERLREALKTAFDCYAAQIPTPTAKIEAAQKLILWNRERALAAIKEVSDEHQQSVSD